MSYWRAQLISLFVFLCFVLVPEAAVKTLYAVETDILITGRVTSAVDGAPIPNVQVMLVDGSFPIEWVEGARTDSAGNYTITSTPYTTWWIRFEPPSDTHLQEFYNDTYGPQNSYSIPLDAEKFVYAPGLQRSGIDAALGVRGNGQIVGTVSEPPLDLSRSWVGVEVYAQEGAQDARWLKQVDVSASGLYTVTDLAPGRYKLHFHVHDSVHDSDSSQPEATYVSEYYNNQSTLAAAAWIEVGAGEIVQADAVELQLGGAIAGVVTSSWTKQPLEYIRTYVYDANDRLVTVNDNNLFLNGTFRVTNLPPGEYKLLFEDQTRQHRPEYYENQTRLANAQLISVEAGEVVPNIQAELTLSRTVVALATSPGLPNAIILALAHDPVPLYTVDGGQRWQSVATTPWVTPDYVPDLSQFAAAAVGLAPRPNLGGHRLIYLHTNLYRSGDEGQTWAEQTPLHECTASSRIFEIYAVPTDENRLYALESCPRYAWAGPLHYSWLSVSRDAGVTWQMLSVIHEGVEVQTIQSVVLSPHDEDRLYVHDEGYRWFRSDKGGESWTLEDFSLFDLQLDAEDAKTLYGVGNPFDLYGLTLYWGQRSEDGGATWRNWEEQPCPLDYAGLVAHPTESEVLFLRCATGLYRSNNGGDAWEQLSNHPSSMLAPDYGVPGRLLWAKDDELWASTDEGDSWQVLMPNSVSASAQAPIPLYLPSVTAPVIVAGE